ncbi:hypothetical protein O5290_31065, partial [Escherichia coli]|nr:hypothetical protein [Escherichia coli]
MREVPAPAAILPTRNSIAYKANWFNDEQVHKFNLDIREVTLSDKTDVLETDAYAYIDEHVPDHDVLL